MFGDPLGFVLGWIRGLTNLPWARRPNVAVIYDVALHHHRSCSQRRYFGQMPSRIHRNSCEVEGGACIG